MDNTNQICIQDACIKQYAAFDTEQMLNFSRDVCHVCGDTPVCRYYNGTSCKPCFYFFRNNHAAHCNQYIWLKINHLFFGKI